MFKRIKLELFYIRELFRYGYGTSFWWPYFKNRFLGNFLLSRLPSENCKPIEGFAIHILSQKQATWMLVWTIKTFQYYCGFCSRVVVHDDGTFDRRTAELLESKFANLKVIMREDADRKIFARTDLTESFRRYRSAGNNIVLKLTDVFLLSEAEKIMVIDNDILFLNKPQEIIDFIEGRSLFDALSTEAGQMSISFKKNYSDKYNLFEKRADFMNTGILLFKKKIFSPSSLFEYFDNTLMNPQDYFVEAAGYSALFAQCNFGFLPKSRYKIKGKPEEGDIIKHFTTPRRHELYAYGIDLAKTKIGL